MWRGVSADNLLGNPGNDPNDQFYDLDNDGYVNGTGPFMNAMSIILPWEKYRQPNPVNPDPRCTIERNHTGNNDWMVMIQQLGRR